MDELRERWDAWDQRPFPAGLGGLVLCGIDLTNLHFRATESIRTFVNEDQLDAHQIEVLKGCMADLAKAREDMTDEHKEYFAELDVMIRMVVLRASDRGQDG